ncbi:hypothetical protein EV215_0277 [Hypnocyclicus thermotrophus]|uniref:Short-subunit dehydrogenase n=1 Tax=Hypnocyclicus thermotrophus TaxID=1627895 RepID=A0AA46E0G5_9FUSO|nr:SDR family NAD(P)-dependent oxidoreductase [Hypnocyclicus thermotrophus]TDT72471.1 hypothetical protein EV215_0277 [Hypnocyclicus thermotrophus]
MYKTALITGASSGMGYEYAKYYAENHYNLILIARRKNILNNIKFDFENKYNIYVTVLPLDLSKNNFIEILNSSINNITIDYFIHCAGIGILKKFINYDIAIDESIIQVNILSIVKLLKYLLQKMEKQNYGRILVVSSTASFQPVPYMNTYSASKSFVTNFIISLIEENKNKNIFISLFCPGATNTEFLEKSNITPSKWRGNIPNAEKVVNYSIKKFNNNKKLILYGNYNKFLIFIQKFLPRFFIPKIISLTIKKGSS